MNDELFYSHESKGMSYGDRALQKLFLRACKEHEDALINALGLNSTL